MKNLFDLGRYVGVLWALLGSLSLAHGQTPQPVILHSFSGGDGQIPMAGLTLGPDGNFYGTTGSGGSGGHGVIFRLSPDGAFTNLVNFNRTNGASLRMGLTLADDGNFYGSTYFGGNFDGGTFFRLATNGTLTTLIHFDGVIQTGFMEELTLGKDGVFYGTTFFGGTANLGTVFKVTTNGVLSTLWNFTGVEGVYPIGALVAGRDGQYYGSVFRRGVLDYQTNSGAIFRITTNGNVTTVFDFKHDESGWPDGGAPWQMTIGSDEWFYGTTGFGSIFKMTASGRLTNLVRFPDDFGEYAGPLLEAKDGKFYGTTTDLGFPGITKVFNLTTSGHFNVLASYTNHNPNGQGFGPTRLTLGHDGSLYGTIKSGGSFDRGAVFRVDLPPTILAQPSSRWNGAGTTARFSTELFGTKPFSYKWLKNGTNLVDGGNVSGVNSDTLTLTNVQPGDVGGFSIVVTNISGSVTSSVATLTVLSGGESAVTALQVGPAGSNTNSLTLAAAPNSVHLVQFTTNLTDGPWFTFATNTADAEGHGLVTDLTATNAQRFYRSVSP